MKIKIVLFLSLITLFIYDGVYAQNYKTFLSQVISGDTINAKSEFVKLYQSSEEFNQQSLRQNILNELEQQLSIENRHGSMNLISLYLSVCDTDDLSLPIVLYIAGENYANMGDTTNLKSIIIKLNNIARQRQENFYSLTDPLNDYLARYRNSVPTIESIEGFWIADFIMNERNIGQEGSPYFIMRILNDGDSTYVEILPNCFVSNKIRTDVPGKQGRYSQIIKPFSKDSLYICWSSSRIVNKSDFGVTALRMTTSELSSNVIAKYSQRNKYSFSEHLTASLATSVIEMGANELLDEIFMPKKKDFVLQARIKLCNNYLMEGTLHYSSTIMRADGKTRNREFVKKIRIVRWIPESGIVFSTSDREPILPNDSDIKTYKKDTSTYFYNAFLPSKKKSDKYVYRYNLLELSRLGLYIDSILSINSDQNTHFIFHKDSIWMTKVICGFSSVDITPETKKKYSLKTDSGVMVYNIATLCPSFFSDLQRGDVIKSIDGIPIINNEDLSKIKFSNNKLTTFGIMRGHKYKTVKIKPTLFLYFNSYRDNNSLKEDDLNKIH